MTSLAALSAAALLASLSAPPTTPPDLPGQVSFSAGASRWDGATGRYEMEGGAVLRRGAVVVRADSASYDPATREVVARGDVLLVDEARAISAQEVHAVLDGPFRAERVLAVLKDGKLDLTGMDTFGAARAKGANRAVVAGAQVDGDADGHLQVSGARVTVCDCGADRAPAWELRARSADVIPGRRATLSWPVLWVTPRLLGISRPVPVLAFPWVYLPLGDRQSGILPPELTFHGATTGKAVALPLYLVLGRSADATLTPEYFFGPGDPHRAQGAVAGPGARLELRWAPAQNAAGEVRLRWLHDEDREPFGAWGDRFGLEGHHAQDLGPEGRLHARLALFGDPVMQRDFGVNDPGIAASTAYYSKSGVLASRRAGPVALELSAAYLEPLAPSGRPNGAEYGWFGGRIAAIQRWPSAAVALTPVRLGPLLLQGRVGLSRLAPVEGDRGGLAPADPGAYRPEGVAPPSEVERAASEREAVTRGETRLELSWPVLSGGISFIPFVRGSATGYAFDSGDPAANAWATAGVTAHARLERRYGAALHRIEPGLTLLAGTGAARLGGAIPTRPTTPGTGPPSRGAPSSRCSGSRRHLRAPTPSSGAG